jgi:hypothetical protein
MTLPASTTLGQMILVALLAAIETYYWSHCIEPAQRIVGAYSRTLRVIQVVGFLASAGFVLSAALVVDRRPVPLWLALGQLAMGIWYTAAWPWPELVARISGGLDSREGLRQTLWHLNWSSSRLLDGAGSEDMRKRVIDLVARLRRIPRTRDTEALTDLWLARADAMLSNGSDGTDRQPISAFYTEARRLWPDVALGRVAVPFGSGAPGEWPDPVETVDVGDSLEQLRVLLWRINFDWRDVADGVNGSTARQDLESELATLRSFPRADMTAPMIDLWLAEGEATLRGDVDDERQLERLRAIGAEARRLWPDYMAGRVAVPFSFVPREWPDRVEPVGSKGSLEQLRQLLWQLNADWRDVADDVIRANARQDLEADLTKLRSFPRSERTARLIDLWLAEGEATLRDASGDEQRTTRLAAIWTAARQLWPDFIVGRMAAPFSPGPREWPEGTDSAPWHGDVPAP